MVGLIGREPGADTVDSHASLGFLPLDSERLLVAADPQNLMTVPDRPVVPARLSVGSLPVPQLAGNGTSLSFNRRLYIVGGPSASPTWWAAWTSTRPTRTRAPGLFNLMDSDPVRRHHHPPGPGYGHPHLHPLRHLPAPGPQPHRGPHRAQRAGGRPRRSGRRVLAGAAGGVVRAQREPGADRRAGPVRPCGSTCRWGSTAWCSPPPAGSRPAPCSTTASRCPTTTATPRWAWPGPSGSRRTRSSWWTPRTCSVRTWPTTPAAPPTCSAPSPATPIRSITS